MGTYEDRKANCLINLNNVEFLSGEYQNRTSQVGALVEQKKGLQNKLQSTKSKTQDVFQSAETYEREFLDRSETLRLPRQGFATLQDGILFLFFIAYFSICIVVLHNMIKTSAAPTSYLFIGFGTFVLFTLGILIAELIRRFA